jgi:HK97 family phage prohead protease
MNLFDSIQSRGVTPGGINVVGKKLVHPGSIIEKSVGVKTPGAIAELTACITNADTDRDGDVLLSSGAELDPLMPLLMFHDATRPIGKLVETVEHSDKRVVCKFALADTALARDALALLEIGGLRCSVGFEPIEFVPAKESGRRYIIQKFTVMETSLVPVPANPQAIIVALQKGQFSSPWIKSWAEQVSAENSEEVSKEKMLDAAATLLVYPEKLEDTDLAAVHDALVAEIKDRVAVDDLLDELMADPDLR